MPTDLRELEQAIQPDGAAVLLRVKVVPGASRSRIAGMLGDRLKIQIAAPPEAGKANKAVCALMAKTLGLPKQAVQVDAGHTQPQKTLRIEGVTAAQLAERLAAL